MCLNDIESIIFGMYNMLACTFNVCLKRVLDSVHVELLSHVFW